MQVRRASERACVSEARSRAGIEPTSAEMQVRRRELLLGCERGGISPTTPRTTTSGACGPCRHADGSPTQRVRGFRTRSDALSYFSALVRASRWRSPRPAARRSGSMPACSMIDVTFTAPRPGTALSS